jgi:hypothetical protein
MNASRPALVSQANAIALPRWLLLLGVGVYALAGLLGRAPWRPDEGAAYGVMRALAAGETNWLTPTLFGVAADPTALLPYWLGAWSVQALPWLNPVTATRVPFVLLLCVTAWAVWRATYLAAQSQALQPVPFAFGGQAAPQAYGKALADGSVLALVAALGMAPSSHEGNAAAVQLAAVALSMAGALGMLLPRAAPHHPRGHLALWLIGLGALSTSGGGWLAVGLPLILFTALRWGHPEWLGDHAKPNPTPAKRAVWLGLLLSVGLILALELWHGLAWAPAQVWASPSAWLRELGWFLWPTWPLLLWTAWVWRRQWRTRPLLLAGLWLAWTLLPSLVTVGPRLLAPTLPVAAMLAALALPTLRRGLSALIDWFAVAFFTGSAFVLWLYWAAMTFGQPHAAAQTVARLAPGFAPELDWQLVLPALAVTLAWFGAIGWRVRHYSPALWRGLALSAAGAVTSWTLLMTLWLPLLNHGLGYQKAAQRVASHWSGQRGCLDGTELEPTALAALRFDAQLDVLTGRAALQCPVQLIAQAADDPDPDTTDGWRVLDRFAPINPRVMQWTLWQRPTN